jgi:hypothetical protein
MRTPLRRANEFVQHDAGVSGKPKLSTVAEGDANRAVGRGLDHVPPINGIVSVDRSYSSRSARDEYRATDGLDSADGQEFRIGLQSGARPKITVRPIAGPTKHRAWTFPVPL